MATSVDKQWNPRPQPDHAEIQPPDPPEHWHIGKKIPLALIITIVGCFIGQTLAAVWWASSLSQRVNALENVQAAQQLALAPIATDVTILKVEVKNINDGITEVKSMIRRRENKAAKKEDEPTP